MAKKTKMIFGEEVKKALQKGINSVARAVSVTMGPGGRLVVLPGRFGQRVVTRDGVTVAKSIQLEDEFENEAAQLVKQVAAKTNDAAGDGTSTSIVLANALVDEGLKYTSTGGNPIALKKGIEAATKDVIQFIENSTQAISYEDVDQIKFIATISGSDPEVGEMVAKAFTSVGSDGVVTFEETKGLETYVELSEGLSYSCGMVSPFFSKTPNNPVVTFTTDNSKPVKILVWEGRITEEPEFIKFLEKLAATKSQTLIFCDDLSDNNLQVAAVNNMRGVLDLVVVKSPGFGERRRGYLQDIAVATGATFFSEEMKTSIAKVEVKDLGSARKITVTSDTTTIFAPEGDPAAVEEHISGLKDALANSNSKFDKEKYLERIAKLSSGIAIIKVGAGTEAELGEKKFRYEDAISATKAALEEGIVAGAGNTLIGASSYLQGLMKKKKLTEDEAAGYSIVIRSLLAPATTILNNAGWNGSAVVATVGEKIRKSKKINYGFDSRNGVYGDLFSMGIIDPAKVTKSAMQNATSIAALVLTTETLIVEVAEDKASEPDMGY